MFTSHSDPASQWTAARKGPAFFSYSDNYLIGTDHGVILDPEPTRSIRQAEAGSTKTMPTRVKDRFGLVPNWMIADWHTAYHQVMAATEIRLDQGRNGITATAQIDLARRCRLYHP